MTATTSHNAHRTQREMQIARGAEWWIGRQLMQQDISNPFPATPSRRQNKTKSPTAVKVSPRDAVKVPTRRPAYYTFTDFTDLFDRSREVSTQAAQLLSQYIDMLPQERSNDIPSQSNDLGSTMNSLAENLEVTPQALLTALMQPEALAILRASQPLAPSYLRGLLVQEQLREEAGSLLGVNEIASRIGATSTQVEFLRDDGRLVALPVGEGVWGYPSWQLDGKGVLVGLSDTLADLATQDPWIRVAFLLRATIYLDGRTPLDCLREGAIRQVRRAARAYGEHGAS